MKKLELNNFLSNIKSSKIKRLNYTINRGNTLNNSTNIKIRHYEEQYYENKNNNENQISNGNYKNLCIVHKYPSSRNFKNNKEIKNLKTSYNNNNIENKLKVAIKKEPKVVITSTIPRYKKGINRIINDENINRLNLDNTYKYKRGYNRIIYKTDNNRTIVNKDRDADRDNIYCICHN